ncbi:hypothetical_protein [Leishmania braziliensis MHOM/BR/75/M2904]|uniref:Hypothetical_protein n=1 Tax=Leishmania braziliensis MHOM/BR/75/M2904 TaxID=420245 RepID=A0A3P3ZE13_LEIBR|nr:hypothetical_protein [Leishmania braziliensis MHOM/BR/75/M2904]
MIYADLLGRLAVMLNVRGTVMKVVEGALALKRLLAGTPGVEVKLSNEITLRADSTVAEPSPPPDAVVVEGLFFQNGVGDFQFVRARQVSLCPSISAVAVLRYDFLCLAGVSVLLLTQLMELQSV